MSAAQHTPGPWSVLERQAKGSTATVWLVRQGSECFRRAGGATFRRRASTFRSAESAARIAGLLNEEAAIAARIENDTHTDADLARIEVVRAAIAKATGSAAS